MAAVVDILYLDDHIVAVNKPAEILVHPNAWTSPNQPTMLSMVRDAIGKRVFPVHRLDRATSGILLMALTKDAASDIGRQFCSRRVKKRYRAIVRGWPTDSGIMNRPLKERFNESDRSLPSDQRAAGPSQNAVTYFKTLDRWQINEPTPCGRFPQIRLAELILRPTTGRWHQIRRHLKHVSHPIIGDTRHGDHRYNHLFATWNTREETMEIQSIPMLLVADQLTLSHPVTQNQIQLCVPKENVIASFHRLIDAE